MGLDANFVNHTRKQVLTIKVTSCPTFFEQPGRLLCYLRYCVGDNIEITYDEELPKYKVVTRYDLDFKNENDVDTFIDFINEF